MNQSNPTARFTFWDFLVDVIPGFVALFLVGTVLPRPYLLRQLRGIPNLSIVGVFTFLVGGYVIGWIVQSLSRQVDTRIMEWVGHTKLMKKYREESDDARDADEWCFERRFFEGAQVFFDHNGADDYDRITNTFDARTLQNLTQSYVRDNEIGRMYRFKVLYKFNRSLYFLFGLGAVIHALLGLLQIVPNVEYVPALGTVESIGLGVFLLLGCWETYGMRKYLETSMVKSMMGDFYTAELID